MTGTTGKKPNILYILADDLGWADVSFHGSDIQTPNLDRLVEGSARFNQHYVCPTCTPTRTCLMSGRYASRYGVLNPTNDRVFDFGTVTLPRALQDCGYETGITGKWHLGSKPEWGPRQFGFDRSYGCLAGGINQLLHLYKRGEHSRTWHRNDEYIEEEGHATDLIGGEAVQWIEDSAKKDKPFFIYVAFTAVHVPIQEPPEWVDKYEGRIDDDSRKRYAACATHMDYQVGRMIDALKRTGQLDKTLIIFASDNGSARSWANEGKYPGDDLIDCPVLGSNLPWRGWKSDVYEGGIRTPGFACWPGHLQPGVVDTPMHMVDWMPTLCDLAGYQLKGDENFDGRNIWPILEGSASDGDTRTLYWKTNRYSAVQRENWKLVVKGEDEELYDMEADPYETEDLSARLPERFKDLKLELEDQQKLDGNPSIKSKAN